MASDLNDGWADFAQRSAADVEYWKREANHYLGRLAKAEKEAAARIAELEAALSAATAERERAERAASNVTSETFRYYLAEAENGLCRIPRRVGDDMWFSYMRIVAAREAAEAEAARLREALEPFVAVVENDIGENEEDADLFRPMNAYNRAPRLTVGHFRKARAALGGEHG